MTERTLAHSFVSRATARFMYPISTSSWGQYRRSKSEYRCGQAHIGSLSTNSGVSVVVPQYLVVLYLTRSRSRAIFISTREIAVLSLIGSALRGGVEDGTR